MKYQTIVFDLFGTLVPYIGKEEFQLSLLPLSNIFELDMDSIQAFWSTEEGYYKAITEYDSTYERVKAFCNTIGIDDNTKINEAIKSRLSTHADWLTLSPTAIETLDEIKANNITVGLISNCSAEVPEIWEKTLLSKYIQVSIFSCIEKMNKSDLAIFELCCKKMNTPAEEIIYVGDSIEELEQAKKLGMQPVLKKTRKKLHWNGDVIDSHTEILKYLDITH